MKKSIYYVELSDLLFTAEVFGKVCLSLFAFCTL